MKIAFASFILVSGLMQTAALADGNTGIVRGAVVRSDTGRPIGNAAVYWINPSGMGSTVTDKNGRFYFLTVSPGMTSVISTRSSLDPGCMKGLVHANETVDVTIWQVPAMRYIDGSRCRQLHTTGHEWVEDGA